MRKRQVSEMGEWDRPAPPKELERLAPLAGEWSSEDVHYPMPWATEGGKGRSHGVFRKALDGYCYVHDHDGETPFGNIKGHGIWSYDVEQKKYVVQWFDNFSNRLDGEGCFMDKHTLVMEYGYRMARKDILERHVVKIQGTDAFEQSIYNLVDGEYHLASVLKFVRVNHGGI